MSSKALKNLTFVLSACFLISILSTATIACPDDFIGYADTSDSTQNFLSSDVLWGLFIVVFHVVIGVIHTLWREKKDKSEVK